MATAHTRITANSLPLLIDYSSRVCLAGNEMALVRKVMNLIQENKAARSAFYKLWSGSEQRDDDVVEVNGVYTIDT